MHKPYIFCQQLQSSSASASAEVSTTSNDPLMDKHFQFLDVEGAEALKSQVGTPSEINYNTDIC